MAQRELETVFKHLAELQIEIEIDLNPKLKCKNPAAAEAAGFVSTLKAVVQLKNSSGGIVIFKVKDKQYDNERNRSAWIQKFIDNHANETLANIGDPDVSSYDFQEEDGKMLCFVKKSEAVLTDSKEPSIYKRTDRNNVQLKRSQEFKDVLKKRSDYWCHCTSETTVHQFKYNEKFYFPAETKHIEYKCITGGKDLHTKVRHHLRDYIVSFGNTEGGTVFFGVEENVSDAIVKGVPISSQEQEDDISRSIKECIESKICIEHKNYEKVSARENVRYWCRFYDVQNAPDGENLKVIVVHICRFKGTIFKKEPKCLCVNNNNNIVEMDFDTWISNHTTADESDGFERTKHGATLYRSVKGTVKEIVNNLVKDEPGRLILLPEHAKQQYHENTMISIQNHFDVNRYKGYAFVEKSWNAILKYPEISKPYNVICDISICSPDMPLTLVTLYQSEDNDDEVHTYTVKIATHLKYAMAQEAGCLEKFFIRPLALCIDLEEQQLLSMMFGPEICYPCSYNMSEHKYRQCLHSLMLLISRSNSPLSHDQVGMKLFNLLTSEQYDILHSYYGNSQGISVQIEGPPGSGKTVIALERIKRLRHEGCAWDSILFLCCHNPLADLVGRMQISDGNPLCRVMTYKEIREIIVAGTPVDGVRLLDNIKHILADEVQNCRNQVFFVIKWYVGRKRDSNEPVSAWLFFDFSQQSGRITKVARKHLESLHSVKKKLTEIMRNTGQIHDFITRNYWNVSILGDAPVLAHDFQGDEVAVYRTSTNSFDSVQDVLSDILCDLIYVKGHKEESITVLCSNEVVEKEIRQFLMIESGSLRKPYCENVHVYRFSEFSGMETNIIIGICPANFDVNHKTAKDRNAMMLLLCSRARLKLILIGSRDKMSSTSRMCVGMGVNMH